MSFVLPRSDAQENHGLISVLKGQLDCSPALAGVHTPFTGDGAGWGEGTGAGGAGAGAGFGDGAGAGCGAGAVPQRPVLQQALQALFLTHGDREQPRTAGPLVHM